MWQIVSQRPANRQENPDAEERNCHTCSHGSCLSPRSVPRFLEKVSGKVWSDAIRGEGEEKYYG